jgi:phage terminase large subunit
MISIPNHPRLIAELSQTLHHSTETGKIKLESKEDMARRGVKSPDFADALALAFSPAGPYRKLIFGA